MRSCIMPELPANLVHELNVGTLLVQLNYADGLTPDVQCRHFIPALNAWAAGHNTRPNALLPTSVLGMDDLTTERSFDSQLHGS